MTDTTTRTATDANRALIRRIFEEVVPTGDTATMRELFAPDWVDHDLLPGQPAGLDGAAYVVSTIHTAHRPFRFTIDDLVAESDRVVIRWTLRATHTGPDVRPAGHRRARRARRSRRLPDRPRPGRGALGGLEPRPLTAEPPGADGAGPRDGGLGGLIGAR